MTEPALEGPYVIEHGDVWYRVSPASAIASGLRHVCGGGESLAVAYDAQNGALHKAGAETSVVSWAAKTRKKFVDGGFTDMADDIQVVVFPITAETVAELNACLACSGRVMHIEKKLGEISGTLPSLSMH